MENKRLVLSTNNMNKLEEIREILKDLPIEVLAKKDIGASNFNIEEDGTTLEENSIKKAKTLSEKTDYLVMADDSGLFVDKLNGEPGVFSSRYAGEEGNDEKNNQKLMSSMENIPLIERTARFRTIITLITEDKEIITVEGECKGHIGYEPKGDNGFGYDPLFIPYGYDKTFGELSEEIKNRISHRGKALEKMKEVLIKLIEGKIQ
ncbi:XTP/dITP diphosphatase [Wansuia hejianensis]|uniref:dITP/XTP pyrophosphatase n=1 Tax=Wansuia hejianensis TaxID=2763667 RepID=A0A926EVR3_9FIRM|nr:XTP/dITP diphosphatase [Wansuia hejianensis]MBC8589796.1 XTP/dITP diphosphatase [Wansuia hejianensis]